MKKIYEKFLVLIIITGIIFERFFVTGMATIANNLDITDRLETIKEKGILTIASANNRPFAYIDPKTNELSGLDSEIALEIASRLGIKTVNIKPIEFRYLLTVLNKDNDIDMVASGLYITEGRKKEVLFTDTWYIEPEGIITPKATKFNFKEDLKDAIIGAESGSVFEELVQKWKKDGLAKDVKTYISDSEVILAVASGQVDAGILDSLAASYAVTNNTNLNLKLLAPYKADIDGKVAAAVKKSDTTLANAINRELDNMKNDGTLASIYRKYGVT